MLAHGATARNFLHVEQICPGLGRLLPLALIGVAAIGKDRGEYVVADEVLSLVLGGRRIDVRRLDVELFEVARTFVTKLIGGRKRNQTHVPGVRFGIDHALNEARRLMLTLQADRLDARCLREGLVKCFFESWRIGPARITDEDALVLRRSLLPIGRRMNDCSSTGNAPPPRQIELAQARAGSLNCHSRLPFAPTLRCLRTASTRNDNKLSIDSFTHLSMMVNRLTSQILNRSHSQGLR